MRQLAIGSALVLMTLAGLTVLWELRGAVLIFFLSLGTSAALRPAIEQLHRWGVPKTVALVVTYLSCVLAVVGLLLALVFPLATDGRQLATDFHRSYERITNEWPEGNALERAVVRRLPPWEDLKSVSWRSASAAATELADTIGSDASEAGKVATESPPQATEAHEKRAEDGRTPDDQTERDLPGLARSFTHRAVQTVVGVTWGFFGTIFNMLIIVVLSLYWSIDRIHFERLWLSLLDVERRKRARETWRAIEQATGAYLQREVVQSLAAGLILGVGFWAMHQPYPVLAAAVGAAAWLIPYIGAPLAMLLVTLLWLPSMALPDGPSLALTVRASAYTVLVLLALEWLVEPRLFPRKRYNPILLVLVAIGMVDWLGLLGLLLAPPIAAAVQILGNQFLVQRTPTSSPADISPQDLALRVATLQARMADEKETSPETQALVARLNTLVEQARALLASS